MKSTDNGVVSFKIGGVPFGFICQAATPKQGDAAGTGGDWVWVRFCSTDD
jgi:hypothetical protein